MEYVIHKWSRSAHKVSYDGPTWDNAGIRDKRQDVYTDLKLALEHAKILNEFNPVGFHVSEKNTDG